jgi:preprotein translocase subunit SecB
VFENPNVHKLLEDPGDYNLRIEVNVNASNVGPKKFESVINFKAEATNKFGTLYDMPTAAPSTSRTCEPQLQPFLLIHCPSLLFPFARRLIADLTREAGSRRRLTRSIRRAVQASAGKGGKQR